MKIIKILYNNEYGGFNLPDEFVDEFNKKYGEDAYTYLSHTSKYRADQRLVDMFVNSEYYEKSGAIAVGEIPAESVWKIHEYDGLEGVSWELPKDTIINDLRLILLRKELRETVNPITQKFLAHGGTLEEFTRDYTNEFLDTVHKSSKTDS